VHGDQHIRHALSFDLAPGEVSNFIFIPVCASIGLERAAVCNDRLRRLPDIPPTPPNSLTSAYRVGGVVQHIVWVASCVGMINAARRHDGRLQTSSIATNAVPALHANLVVLFKPCLPAPSSFARLHHTTVQKKFMNSCRCPFLILMHQDPLTLGLILIRQLNRSLKLEYIPYHGPRFNTRRKFECGAIMGRRVAHSPYRYFVSSSSPRFVPRSSRCTCMSLS
jgi:hypothetical protein